MIWQIDGGATFSKKQGKKQESLENGKRKRKVTEISRIYIPGRRGLDPYEPRDKQIATADPSAARASWIVLE